MRSSKFFVHHSSHGARETAFRRMPVIHAETKKFLLSNEFILIGYFFNVLLILNEFRITNNFKSYRLKKKRTKKRNKKKVIIDTYAVRNIPYCTH